MRCFIVDRFYWMKYELLGAPATITLFRLVLSANLSAQKNEKNEKNESSIYKDKDQNKDQNNLTRIKILNTDVET